MSKRSNILRFTQVGGLTNVVFNLILIFFSLVCIVPMILVLSISLSSENSIREFGYSLLPREFSLEGFGYLITQKDMILRALFMSVFVTGVGTVLGVVLNSSMGYILSRPDYRLKKFFVMFVFIPMIFNGGLVSSYFINSQLLGLKNSVWALILPMCVSSFSIILCRTFFRTTVPDSIIESAIMDGAAQLTIYIRIILPLSLPVLATVGLFLSFAYWNDWFQAMLYLDDSRLFTLQAFLNRLLSDLNYLAQNAALLGVSQAELIAAMPKEAARMAIVVVAVLPIACAYPFFQRFFIGGLTVGAVKG
jgi:putative aldouronate transport system permease protein